jgi:hypothetical protein
MRDQKVSYNGEWFHCCCLSKQGLGVYMLESLNRSKINKNLRLVSALPRKRLLEKV